MKKFYVPVYLALFGMSFATFGADHGHGRVQMQGKIIDTACAISTGDAVQGVDLHNFTIDELVTKGRGPEVILTIHLVNCALNGHDEQKANRWKDVRITFDGDATGSSLFALKGEARGEALVIEDEQGYRARPGEPMPPVSVAPGSMTLRYRLWLMRDQQAIRPGPFYTTVRFFMEYD